MIDEVEKNVEENKEILDARALMTDRIDSHRKDRSIRFLLNGLEKKEYIFRDFNEEETWNEINATYFIESLLLRCEIQPISVFKENNKMIIIDGFQRVKAIQRFFNNESKLTPKGLQKLHFLTNKKFEDLPSEDYKNFILDNCKIKIIEYSKVGERPITNLEKEYVQKQIYIRYNTGIRLKPFEIQKAQFDEDKISQKLKIYIHTEIKEKLKALNILEDNEKESNYEKAMVKIRSLITSTYCPFNIYMKLNGDSRIATEGYIPFVANQNPDEVISIFKKTIMFLYEIVQDKEYQKYEQLHTMQYLRSTYWLYSVLIKDKQIPIEKIDISVYIDYCYQNNSPENYFDEKAPKIGKSHKQRIEFVSKFLEKFYGISMEKYFKEEKKKIKKEEKSNLTIEELKSYQYIVDPKDCDVKDFFCGVEHESHIFHPSYQREEGLNKAAASGLIESSFCKIAIPDILIYRYRVGEREINEIVDGQQRCTSLAAYMGIEYLDENRQFRKSNKHKFALSKMHIFKDCEGKTYHKTKNQLNPYFIERLERASLHLAYIDERHNPHFDPRDHFVRINKNLNPIKLNSFLMWNASCDRWITKRIGEIAQIYKGNLFKQKPKRKIYEQIIVGLMYIIAREEEYIRKNRKEINTWKSISNSTLTTFMEQINDTNRNKYYNYIEKAKQFLDKIYKWIDFIDIDLHEIFYVKEISFPSMKNFHYLYFLLHNFTSEMLLKKGNDIFKIVSDFYKEEKDKEYKEKALHVEKTREKLMNIYMYLIENE